MFRTLMCLILKHRGGPGFGAAMLKEPDVKRFESTLDDALKVLKRETGDIEMNERDSDDDDVPPDGIAIPPMESIEG